MFVKVMQTRHTKIGTLRAGTILDMNQLGPKGSAVIEALLAQENSALEKLTKKQVEAEKEAVVSLEPKVDPEDKSSIDLDVLGDLQKTLLDAEKLNADLQVDLKTMTVDRDRKAETAKSESDRANKAQAFAEAETKRADAADNAAKTLQADLEKAQKSLADATAKAGGDDK